jgi:hypothetical protein
MTNDIYSKEKITLKYILCSQVEKVKVVTDPFAERLKNVEHPIEKIPMQQAAIKPWNIWSIQILGKIFRSFSDKNVIPIPFILYASH